MSNCIIILCFEECINYQTNNGEYKCGTDGKYPATCGRITGFSAAFKTLKMERKIRLSGFFY